MPVHFLQANVRFSLTGNSFLSQCARVWNLMKPHAICGFAVSRTAAEALLAEQPLGSFLVRLCSEAGAFAISCCMGGPGGPYVDHLLIDAVDLQGRSLEHWVLAHEFATQLLDPLSDKVYPKVRPRDLFHPQTACTAVRCADCCFVLRRVIGGLRG